MSTTVWGVALGSTLAWASFDVIRKRLVREVAVAPLSFWVSVAQVPFYVVWALWEAPDVPPVAYFVPAAASILLNLLANLLFLSAMRQIPLSQGIPLLSFTPVFVALSSIPLLGETLSAREWSGVVLVTLGAFGLTLPAGQRPTSRALLRGMLGNRGALYMVFVAALWALAPIFDKLALRHLAVSGHGLVLSLGLSVGMVVVLVARRELSQLRWEPVAAPWIALGGGVNVLALGLQMIAISTLVVSVFEAFKRALGLLLAMAFGVLFFKEKLTAARVAAGLVMAVGVGLVLA